MIEYIYFVKCPGCEDEPFYFFDEAKEFAMSCLSKNPIITQTEVNRNDFGECVDSCDLGTVWSWEEMMKDKEDCAEPSLFTKDFLKTVKCDGNCGCTPETCTCKKYSAEEDPEFTALDNSVEPIINEDDDFFAVNQVTEETHAKYAKPEGDRIKAHNNALTYAKRDNVPYIYGYTNHTGKFFALEQPVKVADGDTFKAQQEFKKQYKNCHVIHATYPDKVMIEDLSVEALVEMMEENEDMVECKWCSELFPKDECRKEVDLGYLCARCEAALKSRGETLTFIEGDLEEVLDIDTSHCVKSGAVEIWGLEQVEEAKYKAVMIKRYEDVEYPSEELEDAWEEMIDSGLFMFTFTKQGNPNLYAWNGRFLNNISPCEIIFEDPRYDAAVSEALNPQKYSSNREALDVVDFFNEDFEDPIEDFEESESLFDEAESVEEVIDLLVKDEEEAITGYEEAEAKIEELVDGADIDTVKEVLDHIKEEEIEHIEELESILAEPEEKLEEVYNPNDYVTLEYDDIEITVFGNKRDVDDWDEADITIDWTYEVSKDEVIDTLCSECLTDEDVPGGLDAFNEFNEAELDKFFEEHFDELFDKYYDNLLDYYREYATSDAEDNYTWEDYAYDNEPDYDDYGD